MRPRDTSPDADRVQLDLLRRMRPGRRFELALELSGTVRELTLAGIRQRHPEYAETEARFALFRILLGDELFKRAYPHAPLVEP